MGSKHQLTGVDPVLNHCDSAQRSRLQPLWLSSTIPSSTTVTQLNDPVLNHCDSAQRSRLQPLRPHYGDLAQRSIPSSTTVSQLNDPVFNHGDSARRLCSFTKKKKKKRRRGMDCRTFSKNPRTRGKSHHHHQVVLSSNSCHHGESAYVGDKTECPVS